MKVKENGLLKNTEGIEIGGDFQSPPKIDLVGGIFFIYRNLNLKINLVEDEIDFYTVI